MKGVVLFIAVIASCLLPASTVYAGSLNEFESQIVTEAKKTYEYNGKQYQVPTAYINQLINYLSSDDVDLTAKERDEALAAAFDSIERGVKEGYLVPVEEEVQSEQGTVTDGSTPKPELPQEEMTSDDALPNQTEEAVTPAGEGEKTGATGRENQTENRVEKIFEEVLSQSNDQVETAPYTPEKVEESIITDTGFNFNNTFIVIVGLIMLMLFGIIATIRFDYFAHDNE